MKVPKSTLLYYLESNNIDNETEIVFKENGSFRNFFTEYKKNSFLNKYVTTFNFSKDKGGRVIDENHELYGLSQIIKSFLAGQYLGRKKDGLESIDNLEEFFESKGTHFCNGYLSERYGEVVRTNWDYMPSLTEFFNGIKKIKERKQYRAVHSALEELKDNN